MNRFFWGVFIMVLCLGGTAFAADTQSLPVSCTIPAIPGVNVPLLVQEREETVELQAKEESGGVRVQTYYAR